LLTMFTPERYIQGRKGSHSHSSGSTAAPPGPTSPWGERKKTNSLSWWGSGAIFSPQSSTEWLSL
jgi:hypothetical protein